MLLKADYHIHSQLSPCVTQEMNLTDILKRQSDRGMDSVAITDHCYSFEYSIKNVSRARLTLKNAISKSIKEELINPEMKVFFGVEAELLEYRYVSVTPELAGEFDFVLVAPNHYHVISPNIFEIRTPAAMAVNELYNFQAAVKNPATDGIAHPFVLHPQEFNMTKSELSEFSKRMMEKLDWKELGETLETARQRDIGVELSPLFIKYSQRHLIDFYQFCIDKGVKLIIGSDAHSLDDLDDLDLLTPVVKDLGITVQHLWRPREWEL